MTDKSHAHDHGHDDHGHGDHGHPAEMIPEGSWQDNLLISLAFVALLGLAFFSYNMFTGAQKLERMEEQHGHGTYTDSEFVPEKK